MNLRQKYDQFMYRHPKVKKAEHITLKTVQVTGLMSAGLAGLLIVAGTAGFIMDKYHESKRKSIMKPDNRMAELIEKNDRDHMLFLDTDGDKSTAEVIINYQTICPTTIEAARRAKVGTVKKVSDWKGSLFDKCWEKHFEWIDVKTRQKEDV